MTNKSRFHSRNYVRAICPRCRTMYFRQEKEIKAGNSICQDQVSCPDVFLEYHSEVPKNNPLFCEKPKRERLISKEMYDKLYSVKYNLIAFLRIMDNPVEAHQDPIKRCKWYRALKRHVERCFIVPRYKRQLLAMPHWEKFVELYSSQDEGFFKGLDYSDNGGDLE